MIPNEVKLKRALLSEIYRTKDHCAIPKNIYEQLAVHFEKELDDSDFELYTNGIQKWVTAVQFARNRLKDEKLILSPKEHKPREWKLSEEGIKVARTISIEDSGYDMWADEQINLENISSDVLEKFKPDEPEKIFFEGKVKYFLHSSKERDKKLVALKKKNAFDKNHLLPCEICNVSFKETYGDIGEGFIEAHHIFPISQLTEETEVKLNDLILICSNCHKMIHNKRPWLTIEQIKSLLT